MEESFVKVQEILNEADIGINTRLEELKEITQEAPVVLWVSETIDQTQSLKLIRQLLQHTPQTALESIILDHSLPGKITKAICSRKVDSDAAKALSEVFDESMYGDLITQEFVERLVDSLDGCSEEVCENLVKVLMMLQGKYLDMVLNSKNSRYFGEMLVFRVNRANGTEKRGLLQVIRQILQRFQKFFYMNDLMVIVEILLEAILNKEPGVLKEAFETLEAILDVKEFFDTGYRFSELFEALGCDANAEYETIQHNILTKITSKLESLL